MKRVIKEQVMVLVHNDGPCADGKMHTVLNEDGTCPVCKFHPDMQSTCFVPEQEARTQG